MKGGFTHIGEIVGETSNMPRMMTDDGRIVSLPKNACRFILELPSGERILVDGRALVGRPEERLKRRLRRW